MSAISGKLSTMCKQMLKTRYYIEMKTSKFAIMEASNDILDHNRLSSTKSIVVLGKES